MPTRTPSPATGPRRRPARIPADICLPRGRDGRRPRRRRRTRAGPRRRRIQVRHGRPGPRDGRDGRWRWTARVIRARAWTEALLQSKIGATREARTVTSALTGTGPSRPGAYTARKRILPDASGCGLGWAVAVAGPGGGGGGGGGLTPSSCCRAASESRSGRAARLRRGRSVHCDTVSPVRRPSPKYKRRRPPAAGRRPPYPARPS